MMDLISEDLELLKAFFKDVCPEAVFVAIKTRKSRNPVSSSGYDIFIDSVSVYDKEGKSHFPGSLRLDWTSFLYNSLGKGLNIMREPDICTDHLFILKGN